MKMRTAAWKDSSRAAVGVFDDVWHIFPDVPLLALRHLDRSSVALSGRNPKGFCFALLFAFLHPFARAVGRIFDALIRIVRAAANLYGRLFQIQPPPRPLSSQEQTRYASAFGSSLALDRVLVQEDRIGEYLRIHPHVVGDTIYLPSYCFDVKGGVRDQGLLDHEMAHVWQHQKAGGLYIHRSVWAQIRASLGLMKTRVHGDARDAYIWEHSVVRGVSFERMNPEQQAEVIRHAIARQKPVGERMAPSLHDRFVAHVAEELSSGRLGL